MKTHIAKFLCARYDTKFFPCVIYFDPEINLHITISVLQLRKLKLRDINGMKKP